MTKYNEKRDKLSPESESDRNYTFTFGPRSRLSINTNGYELVSVCDNLGALAQVPIRSSAPVSSTHPMTPQANGVTEVCAIE